MTAEIPTTEPTEVTAGDTVQWGIQNLPDYPAGDDWVLSYIFRNSQGGFSIEADADGDNYSIDVSAEDTAAWEAGDYSFQAYVTKDGERKTVRSGVMTVKQNFATADTHDGRSHAKRTLDAIEATIEGRASVDQESYTIMGRQLKRTPMADLLKLRDRYAAIYNAEKNAEDAKNGKGGKNKIKVRF